MDNMSQNLQIFLMITKLCWSDDEVEEKEHGEERGAPSTRSAKNATREAQTGDRGGLSTTGGNEEETKKNLVPCA